MEGNQEWINRYSWIKSTKALYGFLLCVTLVHVVAAIISEFKGFTPAHTNPIFLCTLKHNVSISILGLLYVVGLLATVVKLMFINDIFHIKTELIMSLITIAPYFPLWILSVFGYIPIHPSIFPIVASITAFVVTIAYPLYLTYTPFWSTYDPVNSIKLNQLSSNLFTWNSSSSQVSGDVTEENNNNNKKEGVQMESKNEDLSDWQLIERQEYFLNIKHFSIQAWCVELIMFYSEIKDFKTNKNSTEEDVKKIYDKFIKIDSPLELEISDLTKAEISKRIEQGQFGSDIYDRSFEEVCYMIRKNVIPPWKRSTLFHQLQAKTSNPV